MLWKNVLKDWANGKPYHYPTKLKKKFMWNTSVLTNEKNCPFKQAFKLEPALPQKANFKAFEKHLTKTKNRYVVCFQNLDGDTLLIVPQTRKKKNFATIKDFIDNASAVQQKKFWQEVARQCQAMQKTKEKIFVCTHGLGVPYFHLRLQTTPKHYFMP